MTEMPDPMAGPLLPLTDHADNPKGAGMLAHVEERTGRVLNLHRMLAYAPELMQAQSELVMKLRYEAALPRDLMEICILCTAHRLGSDYEWHQHVPMAVKSGVSEERIAAVADWRMSDTYSPAERAALAFTESVIDGETLSPADFAEIRRHYSPREIVELALLVGQYIATARFLTALRVPIETPSA